MFFPQRISKTLRFHCFLKARELCMYVYSHGPYASQASIYAVERTDLLLVASFQLLITAMCPW